MYTLISDSSVWKKYGKKSFFYDANKKRKQDHLVSARVKRKRNQRKYLDWPPDARAICIHNKSGKGKQLILFMWIAKRMWKFSYVFPFILIVYKIFEWPSRNAKQIYFVERVGVSLKSFFLEIAENMGKKRRLIDELTWLWENAIWFFSVLAFLTVCVRNLTIIYGNSS